MSEDSESNAAELERLRSLLCRIKLPLPVRFVADLAQIFPGPDVRMKQEGEYLEIFSEAAG